MNIKKIFKNMDSKEKQTKASTNKKEAEVNEKVQSTTAQDTKQQAECADTDGKSVDEAKEEAIDNKDQAQACDSNDEEETQSEDDEMAKKVETLQKELDEEKDKYLRLAAEFDNYRRRTMKEKTELILNGSEKCVNSILPVLDDLERALSTMDKSEDVAAVSEGVQLIHNKFIKILDSMGGKPIATE